MEERLELVSVLRKVDVHWGEWILSRSVRAQAWKIAAMHGLDIGKIEKEGGLA